MAELTARMLREADWKAFAIDEGASVPIFDTVSKAVRETGATATILLEQIRAAGGTLNELEATLALLGIYEDTGSLTYDATGSRDAAMAAWLAARDLPLEQLEVVRPNLETLYLNLTGRGLRE